MVVVLADGALQVVEVEEEDNMKASIGIFRIIPLIVLILYGGGNFLFAQNTLKVVVLDSATKAPVEAALFSVKYIGETNPKRHALTDSTGTAVIQRVPVGRAEARIDYVGYRTYTATVDVKRGANDIGAVYLASANTLSSITVSATGNQMLVLPHLSQYHTEQGEFVRAQGLEVPINTVDAANRKWIGTEANGAYLISADGQEMIHHFMVEDSPILSNNVQSIAVHPETGEVVFGTDKGNNYSAYSDEKVDEALTKARQTADPAERQKYYSDFQKAMVEDPAYTFFCYCDVNYVSNLPIQGITTDTILGHHGVGIFWNVKDWTIDAE